MSPFNEDSALLLQLIQTPLQRIFLDTEMVSQFLSGERQKNIFRLLKPDLLLEIKCHLSRTLMESMRTFLVR